LESALAHSSISKPGAIKAGLAGFMLVEQSERLATAGFRQNPFEDPAAINRNMPQRSHQRSRSVRINGTLLDIRGSRATKRSSSFLESRIRRRRLASAASVAKR